MTLRQLLGRRHRHHTARVSLPYLTMLCSVSSRPAGWLWRELSKLTFGTGWLWQEAYTTKSVVTKGLIVVAPIINLETQEAWGAVVHLKKELAVRDFMGATYGEPRNVGLTKLAETLQSTYVARRVTLSFSHHCSPYCSPRRRLRAPNRLVRWMSGFWQCGGTLLRRVQPTRRAAFRRRADTCAPVDHGGLRAAAAGGRRAGRHAGRVQRDEAPGERQIRDVEFCPPSNSGLVGGLSALYSLALG